VAFQAVIYLHFSITVYSSDITKCDRLIRSPLYLALITCNSKLAGTESPSLSRDRDVEKGLQSNTVRDDSPGPVMC